MEMVSHVSGVRDLDGSFAKMMGVKLACEEAGVPYPRELFEYFKYPEESEAFLKHEVENIDIKDATREYNRDGTDGFEVDLSKLPDDVKSIRFENSY